MDYNSGPYIVTFPAMQTRMTFNVALANSDAFEDNEKFMLTIKPFSLGIITCDPSQAIVTIVDIEGKYVCHITTSSLRMKKFQGFHECLQNLENS